MTQLSTEAPDRDKVLRLVEQLLALPVKKGSAKDAQFRRLLVSLQSEIRAGLDGEEALERIIREAARPLS
jgi:hypothetical protein